MAEPSVLTYARYFNLTEDYTTHQPLGHYSAVNSQSCPPGSPPESEENLKILLDQFKEAATRFASPNDNNQISITNNVAEYLKLCMSHTKIDYQSMKSLLPIPSPLRNLKLELPIVVVGGGNARRDAKRIRNGVNIDLIIDRLLDDDDVERIPQEDEEYSHTNAPIGLLKLSQHHSKVLIEGGKLEVTTKSVRYLGSVLDNLERAPDLQTIYKDLLSPAKSPAESRIPDISSSDFWVEDDSLKDELCVSDPRSSSFYNRVDRDICDDVKPQSNEEDFCCTQDTQVDEEMDRLLRQFTNHHSEKNTDTSEDALHPKGKPQSEGEGIGSLSAFKTEKASEHPAAGLISNGCLCIGTENLKIRCIDIGNGEAHTLLPLDLPASIRSMKSNRKLLPHGPNLTEVPFHVPTLHEVFSASMPLDTSKLDKFLGRKKEVVSSNELLWKEPGFRVLDPRDSDTDDIMLEDYPVSDEMEGQPARVYPDEISSHKHHSQTSASSKMRSFPVKKDQETLSRCSFEDFHSTSPAINLVKQEKRLPEIMQEDLRSESALMVTPTLPKPQEVRRDDRIWTELFLKTELSDEELPDREVTVPKTTAQEIQTQCRPTGQNEHQSLMSWLPKNIQSQRLMNVDSRGDTQGNDSLYTFLNLRGKQFKPCAIQQPPKPAEIFDDPIESTQDLNPKASHSHDVTNVQKPCLGEKRDQISVPPIAPFDSPRTVIVSNKLLHTRPSLVRILDQSDDFNLTLIYRDLDVNGSRGPDLILNASTCLLVTTLQSLSQRPLPGQKCTTELSQVHDQIASLIHSYSQIVVLVHHVEINDPSAKVRSAKEQASFAAFCHNFARASSATSQKSILPYWIPCLNQSATSEHVNAWVWQLIGSLAYRNLVPHQASSKAQPLSSTSPPATALIQDETVWEVFLCKAGLNPMVAQLVIGALKRPVGEEGHGVPFETGQAWGLRRLVTMALAEKVKLLAGLIGRDVVERLDRVLSGTDRDPGRCLEVRR